MYLNNESNIYELKKPTPLNEFEDSNLFPHVLVLTEYFENKFNQIVKMKKTDNELSIVKNEIDKYYKNEWDIVKKITNPFEMIYLTNKQHKMYSLSLYEPISRSYFKMIEMMNTFFYKLKSAKKLKTLHLAEGPGGFIEGMINFRNDYISTKNKKDTLYGITLISNDSNIPGWNKNNKFLNKQTNVNLLTGVDNKGDLYNIHNHLYLIDKFKKHSIDFITGDGGFDFSNDYNLQEENALKLIYSQIILTLSLLKKNGSFICKLFDTYNELTKEVLFLLFLRFEKVIIYKPFTSRIANSERYIICKNYNPISTSQIFELLNVLNIWNKIDKLNEINNFKKIKIRQIFNIQKDTLLEHQYNYFKNQIEIINKIFEKKQIQNIKKTINIIKYRPRYKWYKTQSNIQIKTAAAWCKKFNVPYRTFIHNLNYKYLYDLRF